MVINFNIHKISRNICKLAVIFTLKKKLKPFSLDYDLIDKGIFLADWYVSYLSSSPFFFHCQLMCHLIVVRQEK
jgi:hypothetical protein